MKWFDYDLIQNKSGKSSLLKYIAHSSESEPVQIDKMDKVKTENEILAMCYFNYLEERGFLGQTSQYLFGDLLKSVSLEYDEPVLILLEMLKTFYPAGLNTLAI